MQDAERPHHVEPAGPEGPLEDVHLHHVAAGMAAVVAAGDIDPAREIDPHGLGPGPAGDVQVASEAAADVEDELVPERLDGDGRAEVAAQVSLPLRDELGPRWPQIEPLAREALERVGECVAPVALGRPELLVPREEVGVAPLHLGEQRPAEQAGYALDDGKGHPALPAAERSL